MASHIGRRTFLATLGGAAVAWPLAQPTPNDSFRKGYMHRRSFPRLLSATVAWPYVAAAQSAKKRPLVGMLLQGTPAQVKGMRLRQSFFDGMRELGFIEGRDFDTAARVAETTGDLPRLAKELVQLNPDVILATASANALAAKTATSTIPIVVPALGNPIALGLIETDARPGGNLTGIMPYVKGLPTKQLELAREIVPGALKIGIAKDPTDAKAIGQWDEIEATAPKLDIKIVSADVQKPEDVELAFKKFKAENVGVVVVLQSNLLILERARIAANAAATRLPTVYGYREHVEAGGLISYGVNLDDCFRRAATYIHQILKGTPVTKAEEGERRAIRLRMERKPIPCKSLAQYAEDPLGIEHVLERHDGIVSEADKGTSPFEARPHIVLKPFIQHMVKEDV
jgi:putative tryptophan/tyrosine transport system substrate-binding protein